MNGTLDQITQLKENDQLNENDIIVATDYPLIVSRGQMINGSGAPVWDGITKSFGNTPLQLKDLLTKRLKKALYFGDTSQPKFDITITQSWKFSTIKPGIVKKTGFGLSSSSSFKLYKMFYDEGLTTFSHYESPSEISNDDIANVNTYSLRKIKEAGFATTTFRFPIKAGALFFITPCESPDWLCTEIDHEWCCPGWDDQKNSYKKIYGMEDVDEMSYSYFQKDQGSQALKCLKDGYVLITCVNGYMKNGYPLAKISFE